jgi:pimeloyl-ACP methyl ester carboxylesterase
MVAARDSDVAFVVLLASIGIRGDQLISLQQRLISEASGISDKSKVINRGLLDVMQHSSSDMEQLKNDLTAFLEQATQDISEEEEEEDDDDDDDDDDLFIKDFVDELVTPWLQYFISYDPATTLEKVKCPVLAINGEKDVQVPAKPNLEAIEAALTRGGNRHITVKEMSGLNHLFQECATGLPAEYPAIEQTFSPVAMSEILAWIKARTE